MKRGRYEHLVDEIPKIVKQVEVYPEHLQATLADSLCRAFLGPIAESSSREMDNSARTDGLTVGKLQVSAETAWDYRTELFELAKEHEIGLKELNQKQFVVLMAYVLKVRSPRDQEVVELTPELLEDACRAAGHRQPADAGAALRTVKHRGYLDKKKGQKGYSLTAAGENMVNDMLADKEQA